MPTLTIFVIRHAEKPTTANENGVDELGHPDPGSLTPRGWQRAGAWVQLFVPVSGLTPVLPCPTAMFASNPAPHGDDSQADEDAKSRRPLETITPLAAMLSCPINYDNGKNKTAKLVDAAVSTPGVVLICWQHEKIVEIAGLISPGDPRIPTKWPGDRYNVIFQFERTDDAAGWTFKQIVPVMLAGDSPEPIVSPE